MAFFHIKEPNDEQIIKSFLKKNDDAYKKHSTQDILYHDTIYKQQRLILRMYF